MELVFSIISIIREISALYYLSLFYYTHLKVFAEKQQLLRKMGACRNHPSTMYEKKKKSFSCHYLSQCEKHTSHVGVFPGENVIYFSWRKQAHS